MVERLLGVPDLVLPNPNNRLFPPMKLFAVERIKRAERTKQYRLLHAQMTRRRAAAARAVSARRERHLAAVEAWAPSVPTMERSELNERAREREKALAAARMSDLGFELPDIDSWMESEQWFLDRVAVDYLWQRCTCGPGPAELDGKVVGDEVICALRSRVLKAIAGAYPELTDECARRGFALGKAR